MSDDWTGYDRWRTDSGREGEHDDRTPYRLVVCAAGHRRLVRPGSPTADFCWSCHAKTRGARPK